jgi:hypothetical protein
MGAGGCVPAATTDEVVGAMRHRLVQPVDPPPSAVTRFRFPSAVYLTALCR